MHFAEIQKQKMYIKHFEMVTYSGGEECIWRMGITGNKR